ncbi:hypothetical protein CsSME_00011982 [Camellia sinensis var. sinensis]
MGKYRFLVDSPGAMTEFRREYHIPNNVHLSLAELDTMPRGKSGFVPFTVVFIVDEGLRFLVQPLICEFLRQTRLCPTQLSSNTYRIINSIAKLNRRLGLNLRLAELFHQYSIGQNDDGWVYYLTITKPRYRATTSTGTREQLTHSEPRYDTNIGTGLSCSMYSRHVVIVEKGKQE